MSDSPEDTGGSELHDESVVQPLHAECPRCGYRLDGAVIGWAEHCPLHGLCNECGYDIVWSEVLVPHKYFPRWSFEHAARGRLARTCVSTFCRLARPKRFLTELKMSDAVRPKRLTVFLGLLVVLLLLGSIMLQTSASIAHWSQIQSGWWTIESYRATWVDARVFNASAIAENRRTIQPGDLPTPWPFIVDGFRRPLGSSYEFTLNADGERWYAGTVGSTIRMQLLVGTLPVPADQGLIGGMKGAIIGLGIGLLAATVIPLSFVLLPWTRARCGVRFRHVVRVGIYSIPMMVAITIALIAFAPFGALYMPGFLGAGVLGSWLGGPWGIGYALAASAYVYVWWGRAMSYHLHLPRPWFVVTMLMLIAMLIVPFVAMAVGRFL